MTEDKTSWTHEKIREFAGVLGKRYAEHPIEGWWGGSETKNEAAMNALQEAPDEIWRVVEADIGVTGGELQDDMVDEFIRGFERARGIWPRTWEPEAREYATDE